MGIIEEYSKWDLEYSVWNKPCDTEKKRSFAVCTYNTVIHSKLRPVNYIIFAYGSRVEDHSKNYRTLKEKSAHISHVLSYLQEKTDENYIVKFLMLDADAPLSEQSKKLASYVDMLATNTRTNSINIIGLSKCGAMNMYVAKNFKNPLSYEVTNIYNIATPYEGTKLASPNIFYPEVKDFFNKKIGDNKLSNYVYEKSVAFYESISSNSHMDYDIAKDGGVPEDRFNKYDKKFVKEMLSKENIDSLKRVNSFTNFITGTDEKTLGEALRTFNAAGIGLCLLNDWFFDGKGDGLVLTEEQYKIENYLDTTSIRLPSSHHRVNSVYRVFDVVLDKINDNVQRTRK